MAMLARVYGEPRGHQALGVLHFATALAHLRIEFVAQDREQPSLQIGAWLEALMLVPSLDQRLLHQVVRLVGVLGQRHCEGAQTGNRAEQIGLECCGDCHAVSPFSARVQPVPAG